jgi:hypothetical protein
MTKRRGKGRNSSCWTEVPELELQQREIHNSSLDIELFRRNLILSKFRNNNRNGGRGG